MDQIRLTGIRAAGKHGVLDFEHERAQTFVVDATLSLDLAPAGRSDALDDTVDYGAIAKGIVAIIEGEHADLIERLAARIADMILQYPAVQRAEVTVHKPNAPIVVPFDDVSVSTLRDAVRCIDGLDSTQVTGISPLYRTDAWGMPAGTPDFRNAVVSVNTKLTAPELLAGLQRIEASHGRVRTDHWTSRTLDLDIIDFDGIVSDDPDLTLPHPRAWQRAFVLGPWLALDPDAELVGAHAGSVAQLLFESSDREHIDELAEDWMVADDAAASPVTGSHHEEPASLQTGSGQHRIESPVRSRRAVISMDSPSTDAERRFRKAIVSLDGIPGNQVEGISPLYHVSQLDGKPDNMAAVMQISTRMGAAELITVLGSIETSVGGSLDLDLIDMEGVVSDEPNCQVPWPTARNHAAVLAPWLDMDPDARLGGDPVSFLLAMAPDTSQVGLLTDNWIIGDTL